MGAVLKDKTPESIINALHHPTVGNPISMHHAWWRAFIMLSGVLSFSTAPFTNFVKVHTIHNMCLPAMLLRSNDTTELKSVALGMATAGLDADLLFFLQISHSSSTLSMFFRVSVSNLPAFLNAYSICSRLLWLSFLWIASTAVEDLMSFSCCTRKTASSSFHVPTNCSFTTRWDCLVSLTILFSSLKPSFSSSKSSIVFHAFRVASPQRKFTSSDSMTLAVTFRFMRSSSSVFITIGKVTVRVLTYGVLPSRNLRLLLACRMLSLLTLASCM